MSRDPRIVRREAFSVVGIALFGNPAREAFERAWGLFGQIADEVPWLREEQHLYGVQIYPPGYPQQFEFMYLAGVEAGTGADVPIRCVRKDLPSADYALFPVENGPQGIDAAYRYAYKDWLPSSGYDPAWPYDFEEYELRAGAADSSAITVWVPVKARAQG